MSMKIKSEIKTGVLSAGLLRVFKMFLVSLSTAVLCIAGAGIGQSALAGGLLGNDSLAGKVLSSDANASQIDNLLNPNTDATCLISGHRVFIPGISLTPTRGVWFADQPTNVTCSGKINGKRLAGPGELTVGGTYGEPRLLTPEGDTCLSGRMLGDLVARAQTEDGGFVEFSGQLIFTRIGLEIVAEGVVGPPEINVRVLIAATPDVGQDCFLTPITGVNIVGIARLTGN